MQNHHKSLKTNLKNIDVLQPSDHDKNIRPKPNFAHDVKSKITPFDLTAVIQEMVLIANHLALLAQPIFSLLPTPTTRFDWQ